MAENADPIRTSVTISRLDHVSHLRLRGDRAWNALDRLCPTALTLRDGQIIQSLLLDESAQCVADLYVGLDDEELFLLAEGPTANELIAHLRDHLGASAVDVEIEDRSTTHGVLSLDGPYAWELLGLVVGQEALGLPYLTFFHLERAMCYRAGKTGEYGYGIIAPVAELEAIERELRAEGVSLNVAPADVEILDRCALENGFFNIRREGREPVTPIELQLQWRVSYTKEFIGSRALSEHRRAGVHRRITSLAGDAPFAVGDDVSLNRRSVGHVVNAAFSPTRGDWVGLALLDVNVAHPGIDEFVIGTNGTSSRVRSISPPMLNNRSLFVSPQLHSYGTRHEYTFPPLPRG